MLGEIIGEFEGSIIGQRVLRSDVPTIETTIKQDGKILDIEAIDLATYCSILRSDGTMFGECQGMTTTKYGEIATWIGHGAGKPIGNGQAAKFRGAIYYQSSSEKLSCLNCVAVIYEYEIDDNGDTQAKLWEWK